MDRETAEILERAIRLPRKHVPRSRIPCWKVWMLSWTKTLKMLGEKRFSGAFRKSTPAQFN